MIDLRVSADPAGACAERLLESVRAGHQVALTGGSTPRDAYERAAAAGADWSQAELWFGDERCVERDDERSNYGMVKAALLDRLAPGAPPEGVHRMLGELGPDAGAERCAGELHDAFGAGLPRFDLILLGLGPDAHCGSMFPDKPAVSEVDRLVVGVPEPGLEPWVPRITFTMPLINAAAEVCFLVAGADKADAVAKAFAAAAERGPHAPASLVEPADGRLTVILDEAAAARLDGGTR